MNKQIRLIAGLIILELTCGFAVNAQVAGNPPYTLEQSVIVSGGGQNSTGGNFTVDGTIGQTAAGTRSTASAFSVTGGFWTANAMAPTAALVTISGRVLTPDGRGLRNARLTLTDLSGSSRTVLTGAFGNYRFPEVSAGETVIISIVSKRYNFQPQVVTVMEDIEGLNFNALSSIIYSVEPVKAL